MGSSLEFFFSFASDLTICILDCLFLSTLPGVRRYPADDPTNSRGVDRYYFAMYKGEEFYCGAEVVIYDGGAGIEADCIYFDDNL